MFNTCPSHPSIKHTANNDRRLMRRRLWGVVRCLALAAASLLGACSDNGDTGDTQPPANNAGNNDVNNDLNNDVNNDQPNNDTNNAPGACADDGQCRAGQICEDMVCVAAQCALDPDCPADERCQQGRCVPRPDADEDGVIDRDDNCPDDPNPDQANADGDGQGDVCDGDRDGDGVDNDGDNCPDDANAEQDDAEGDGVGDACDLTGTVQVTVEVLPAWIPDAERFSRVLIEAGEQRFVDQRVRESRPVTFEDVPDGVLTVRTQRSGFEAQSIEITIDPETTTHEVTLQIDLRDLAQAQLNLAGVVLDAELFGQIAQDEINIQGADFAFTQVRGDLSELGLNLTSANFASATFEGVNLSGANLERVNFSGADIRGTTFIGANMERVNFASADMRGCVFIDPEAALPEDPCDPEQALLSMPQAVFAEAEFEDGVLDGANLTGAVMDNFQMPGGSIRNACLRDGLFQGALFDGVDLSGTDLDGADMAFFFFNGGNLTGSKLTNAALNLGGFSLVTAPGVDLSGSICSRINLTDADLTGATLNQTMMDRATLVGTNLSGASITDSTMGEANLTGATLPVALAGQDFGGADLTGVDLSGRTLTDAIFVGATLADADLTGAVVDGADFTDAIFDDATLCPDGQTHAQNPGCDLQ